jgi:hypothetical protein
MLIKRGLIMCKLHNIKDHINNILHELTIEYAMVKGIEYIKARERFKFNGVKIDFYEINSGTSRINTYDSEDCYVPNRNPLQLNSYGSAPSDIYIDCEKPD